MAMCWPRCVLVFVAFFNFLRSLALPRTWPRISFKYVLIIKGSERGSNPRFGIEAAFSRCAVAAAASELSVPPYPRSQLLHRTQVLPDDVSVFDAVAEVLDGRRGQLSLPRPAK